MIDYDTVKDLLGYVILLNSLFLIIAAQASTSFDRQTRIATDYLWARHCLETNLCSIPIQSLRLDNNIYICYIITITTIVGSISLLAGLLLMKIGGLKPLPINRFYWVLRSFNMIAFLTIMMSSIIAAYYTSFLINIMIDFASVPYIGMSYYGIMSEYNISTYVLAMKESMDAALPFVDITNSTFEWYELASYWLLPSYTLTIIAAVIPPTVTLILATLARHSVGNKPIAQQITG
jgi:hypothetical protein